MFILSTITDLIRIIPEDLLKPSAEAIEDNINKQYCNKILPKLGLCICLFDLLEVGDGLIGHGDGLVNVNVIFRMVIFRPFRGEVIQATLTGASPEGMRVATSFFDQIFVSKHSLFDGCTFDVEQKAWKWDTGDDVLWLDIGEPVRVRIDSESFHDHDPSQRRHENLPNAPPGEDKSKDGGTNTSTFALKAYMNQDGLGSVGWWEDS